MTTCLDELYKSKQYEAFAEEWLKQYQEGDKLTLLRLLLTKYRHNEIYALVNKGLT